MRILLFPLFLLLTYSTTLFAQTLPAQTDPRIYDIIKAVSAERLEADINTLVNFGTRHTFSDTVSDVRGIGAARRWILAEFQKIGAKSESDFEVFYNKIHVKPEDGSRIPFETDIVSVVAIQRGTVHPNKYIIMSGDIDSRISDPNNYTDDSPGANDNASGMAGTIEAARVLSKYQFPTSIIYAGLAGEEQGLFGGKGLAEYAKEQGWDIVGVLNNDMIGNISGVDGVIDNRTFRIFSEPTPVTESEQARRVRRFYGGEVDGVSRQLARYVHKTTQAYMPEMNPMMIYRLDRFGRGGHHRPFNDAGFAGIRIMEAHENYDMQHQDLRTEEGITYGDTIDGVNFDYAAKLTAVNAISLAAIAWAPEAPKNIGIGGAVRPSTTLVWDEPMDANIVGYKLYWRDTTSPQWQYSKYVGKVNRAILEGIVIDNFLFGVASISASGHESLIQFPGRVVNR
jgi:Zn-dependent M28 family amino/carboxypeptidase